MSDGHERDPSDPPLEDAAAAPAQRPLPLGTSEAPAATPRAPASAPSAVPAATVDAPEQDDDEEDEEDEEEDEDDFDERGRSRARSDRAPPRDEARHGHSEPPGRSSRRPGLEGLFRDSFRKAVERGLEVGIGTLKSADHVVRNVADEVKLPKELSNYLFSQIDETKNVLIRAVASEVREFLDATDISTELQRALTALSFEVKMEIRFIPNDKGELKPKVKARAVPRARRRGRDDGSDD